MVNIAITDSGPWWWKRERIHRFSHPSKWEEVTPKQMKAIAKLLTGEIKEDKLLSIFLSCPRRIVKKLDDYARYKLSDLMSFISIKQPVDRFIIQKIKGRKAPEKRLKDLSFAEFMFVDTLFADYSESENDTVLLRKFVGHLFRRHKKGKRPEFDGNIDWKWTQKVKLWEMHAAILNYGLIRTWLEKSYPAVFTEQKNGKSKSNGWVDVFDSIVGDDIVHSDEYASKPVMEVLRFLNKKIIESRKLRHKKK
ncbi:hypothetical protein ACT29H_09410 [Thermophagus sp. OGC60D27]|uniref:hypothetical protein n=1 Tax=Thermophagus sp. OGC60D27 TaxID=3458415 RepID=UPI00403776A0